MYNEPLKKKVYEKLEKLLDIYAKQVFIPVAELTEVQYLDTREHLRTVPTATWLPAEKGDTWGGEWQNRWYKVCAVVPAEAAGKKLFAVSACGGVEQLFFVDGKPVGLFSSKNEFIGGEHSAELICDNARPGDTYELAFECYAGHFCVGSSPYDNYGYPDIPQADYMHTYEGIQLCVMDEEMKDFIFDLRSLLQVYKHFPHSNFTYLQVVRILDKVADAIIFYPIHYSGEQIKESVRKALAITRPFFENGGNSRVFGRVGFIGHSHMDTAWLWPWSETIRKCARTYSNALSLMRQYPEYRFIQSSALHCEWMKDYYPDIFEEMQQRVAEGRYEPNGGVYVECDCNITSGEFMIRQFLKGQLFTRKYFNYTSDCFWLPDTFGYNANIPQIMQGCDVKYFYTTKMSWNEHNRFPFESFRWRGIDGTEVLTHLNRMHCFPDVADTIEAIDGIQLKDTTDMRLVSYGFGDGGGGPTYGMLECARRTASMPGMPEVENETISAFMQELEKDKEYLPVFDDEMYLELHRGTLTQMHDVKRKNRKTEFAIRNLEYFNVLTGAKPWERTEELTKILLRNQFHDILPGTCITPVYEKYNKEMDGVLADLRAQANAYEAALTDADNSKLTLFNTLSFARHDAVVIENEKRVAKGCKNQHYTDVCGRECLAIGDCEIPGFGSLTVEMVDEADKATSPFRYDGTELDTPFASIRFGADGYIASFVDKLSGRELRKEGGAPLNCLLFGEDVPISWDNWDLESDTIARLAPADGFVSRTQVTDGAVELRLRSVFKLTGGTSVTQDMVVYADSPRVDFQTLVDWKTPHTLLKVGFDLDLRAKTARNEIQYGYVERPTTVNSSLECAKFEVCNYKWTDISENRFGAAVLNDCKYGVTVLDTNIRLSLHRGGTHPDVTGDCGLHEMTYSFLPHNSTFTCDTVVKPAYELNIPVEYAQGAAMQAAPFIKVEGDGILCETIKPAELAENAYVLRLYETERNRSQATLTLAAPCKKVFLTNMLEDKKEEVPVTNGSFTLVFKPFEIITVLIER